jgi:hypothetical protein
VKKAILLVLAALMVPGVAFAAKSPHAKPPAQATYVLKGTLSNYTPYNASTSTNGSITVLVSHASDNARSLKGQTLTFPVDSKTVVELADHVTAIANGDEGSVTVRAAKHVKPADLAATLQASSARKIHDVGAPKVKVPHPVTYVVSGTLSNYMAYDSVTPANGSITIVVAHGNRFAKSLKGQTLTFPVDGNSVITLEDGVPAIANGDRGVIKIRAVKRTSAADLQAIAAKQIVDHGATK